MNKTHFLALCISILPATPSLAEDITIFDEQSEDDLWGNPKITDISASCESLRSTYGMTLEERAKHHISLQEGECAISYEIRDIGPAGGLVFYVTDGGKHGLEVSPDEFTRVEWGCHGVDIEEAYGEEVGDGKTNTEAHSNYDCVSSSGGRVAFDVVRDYKLKGFTDWYVPSRDELEHIHNELNSNGLGGFSNKLYWTSSNTWSTFSWVQHLGTGRQGWGGKNLKLRVRPIRSF